MKAPFFSKFSHSGKNGGQLRERSDIPPADRWQLNSIFQTDQDWEAAVRRLEEMIPRLSAFQGRLGNSATDLLGGLQLRDQIEELLGRVYLYAGLISDQDTRISQYQAYREKSTWLTVKVGQATAFIHPEILSIPEVRLQQFLEEEPGLASYRHHLDDLLRSRPHVLPPEQEHLLAMAGEIAQVPQTVFSMFNNADIKFPSIRDENDREIEVTKGRYSRLMESHDRRVRRDAFFAMYSTYALWKNTLAATLSGSLKRDLFYAQARRYQSSLHAALDADNIPVAVYENVLSSINHNLEPLHRYMGLRKKLLGLEELHPWDLSVPLSSDLKLEVPYSEARGTIEEALHPLGESYLKVLRRSFREGWIDVYENKGKRSGAYSWSSYGAHPYILLNYDDTLNDMFTVAHELGHALHSYFTCAAQPFHYSRYTIFVAEVASTLNEALLIHHLLNTTTDRAKKRHLLNEYIDQIRGTVYIQALFAEFEKLIHERLEAGEALTAEVLNRMCREIYQRYFGAAFSMDPEYDLNWCRIPHFYYNYYVYQYVTGFSAATALSQRILAGDTKARDAYLEFLSRGCSRYSIDLLKDAGVDMTSPQPIEATTRLMASLLDQLQSLE